MSGLHTNVARSIRQWVGAWPESPDEAMLFRVLRYLCQWRSIMLANTYVQRHGPTVWGGPFKGMAYVAASTEGALMPRLLGVYESELHPHLQEILGRGVEQVIDLGCAEGYYAVGVARLAPNVTVHARDIDPKARQACARQGSMRRHQGSSSAPSSGSAASAASSAVSTCAQSPRRPTSVLTTLPIEAASMSM